MSALQESKLRAMELLFGATRRTKWVDDELLCEFPLNHYCAIAPSGRVRRLIRNGAEMFS